MNNVIKRISLDVNSTGPAETITVKRRDTGRELWFYLFEDGAPYVISKDCSAVFAGTKPDGKAIHNPCTIKPDDTTDFDNCVRYEITEQTVASSGKMMCEVRLYGDDGSFFSCPPILLDILPRAYDEEDIESSDEITTPTDTHLQKFYNAGYGDGAGAVADGSIEHLKSNKVKTVVNSSMEGKKALQSIDLPNVEIIEPYAFCDCTSLTKVNIPKCVIILAEAFCNCNKIKKIDLPSLTKLGTWVFMGCQIETLILRTPSEVVPLPESACFMDGPIGACTGYVYVPKALVDSYKSATNWSAFADQIRAIEDYPEITEG